MTTFCEVVTSRHDELTTRAARLGTTVVGEAMTPAPGSPSSGGNRPGAGVALVFRARRAVVALLLGCGCAGSEEDPAVAGRDAAAGAAPRLDAGLVVGTGGTAASAYWGAWLEQMIGGNAELARAGFEATLARAAEDPDAAARAAVELAGLEIVTGNRRRALELLARAQSLAPGDPSVTDAVSALSSRVAATPAGESDVRGPAPGTPLAGVDAAVQAQWRAAEQALVRTHRLRIRPMLESLSGGMRIKATSTESTVRAYRQVALAGGAAEAAAEFRIGTLYHDLAVELVFDLPPELDPGVAADLRRELRNDAVGYLKRAVAAYQRAGAVALEGPDADPWRVAAEAAERAARELAGAGR